MLLDFFCPRSTTHFQNECGCGCEMSPECPEYFDCAPPKNCDVEQILAKCPYSTITD